jgi:hypothetical protein
MINKKITYPQYRKYKNNKSYFKIISPNNFEEIQILGKNKTIHIFEAKILPDRNYIADLTFNYNDHWVICLQSEYEELRETNYS